MERNFRSCSFSLPKEMLAWVKQQAKNDMRPTSQWLQIQLMKIRAEMETKAEGGTK